MKGKKEHRATGGANQADDDLKTKPARYTADSKVNAEAEERKSGGRAKKHVGDVSGEAAKAHAGRKPRKNGGRTGADGSPFSSARTGTAPAGRKLEMN